MQRRIFAPAVLSLAILLAVTPDAHAYLDPGTGSMLLQLLLGGIAGALIVMKLYWFNIKAFLSFGSRTKPGAESSPPSQIQK